MANFHCTSGAARWSRVNVQWLKLACAEIPRCLQECRPNAWPLPLNTRGSCRISTNSSMPPDGAWARYARGARSRRRSIGDSLPEPAALARASWCASRKCWNSNPSLLHQPARAPRHLQPPQAQRHCQAPRSSSSTSTSAVYRQAPRSHRHLQAAQAQLHRQAPQASRFRLH